MTKATRKIVFSLLTVAAFILMYFIRDIVTYVVISIVLTIIFAPFMRLLDKVTIKNRRLPDWLKALACLLILYAVIGILINVFAPILVKEIKDLSQIKLEDVNKALSGPINFIEQKAEEWSIQDNGNVIDRRYLQNKVVDFLDLRTMSSYFTSFISGIGSLLLAVFSVSFITFFLLKDRHITREAIEILVPRGYVENARHVVENANRILQRYFIGLIIQISVISTFVSVSLSIIGIKNALLIGFFAGLINIIPYLGPAIGATVGIIIALTTNMDMYTASDILPLLIKMASVFAIVQLLDNFVFQPLIFSNSINAHPLEIFLVILVGGTLFGIPGMIIAIPSYSFIRIVVRELINRFDLNERFSVKKQ